MDFLIFIWENEPQSYKAISSPKGPQWKEPIANGETIASEIDSILQNYTWELVDFSPKSKSLGYKWIFKKIMKLDSTIDKYKASLIIKGYRY